MKHRTVIIACGPGVRKGDLQKKITMKELEELQEKTPTLTISCANGEHEDCGGEGCECDCKHGKVWVAPKMPGPLTPPLPKYNSEVS